MSLARPRRARRLRTRLIAVVVLTAVGLAVVLGIASSIALQSSLRERLDQSLLAASARSQTVPPSGGWGGDQGAGDQGAGDQPADPDPDPGTAPDSTTAPDSGSGSLPPDWLDGGPPGLLVRGTATGTVVLEVRDDVVLAAGYLDASGELEPLTPEQIATLRLVGSDVEWVDLPGLGRYRALAVERPDGIVVATALPWAESADTLRSYLIVEVLVSLAAVALATLVAALLVRSSLRPLDRVARTAHRVSELTLDRGDVGLTERVPPQDTDERTEVGTVGASLNRLLGHVEASLASRQASETKVRQFVADASHELRTPLASIRGYTELLLRRSRSDDADTTHALVRVAAESRRMQALVEDLLLLARLDQGSELVTGEVDLIEIAADVTADAHVAGPDHEWHLDIPPDGLGPVRADEARLRQVLVNLAANARVHTPAGTRVTVAVASAGPDRVHLSVTDDGPGIAPERLPALFDRFARGDDSRTRTDGETRTGLGLAIAEAIVQAHGGTLGVESRPGRTRFLVELPVAGDGPRAEAG